MCWVKLQSLVESCIQPEHRHRKQHCCIHTENSTIVAPVKRFGFIWRWGTPQVLIQITWSTLNFHPGKDTIWRWGTPQVLIQITWSTLNFHPGKDTPMVLLWKQRCTSVFQGEELQKDVPQKMSLLNKSTVSLAWEVKSCSQVCIVGTVLILLLTTKRLLFL